MSRTTAGLSVSTLLAACSLFTEPTPADRLEDARRLWHRGGPADYIYETRVTCFCGGLAGRWIEVTVMGNAVVRGRYADTGQEVEAQWLELVPTIEDLFESVEHFIDQDPDQLDVVYDPADGHPISITVDIRVQTADDEVLIESRNLRAMLTALGLPR